MRPRPRARATARPAVPRPPAARRRDQARAPVTSSGARRPIVEAAEMGRRTDDADLFARAPSASPPGCPASRCGCGTGVQTDLLEEALVRLGADDSAPARAGAGPALGRPLLRRVRRPPARAGRGGSGDGAPARRPGALAGALAAHCDAVAGPAVRRPARAAGRRDHRARPTGVPDVGLELLGLRLRVIARLERGDLVAAQLDMAEFERLVDTAPTALLLLVRRRSGAGCEAHLAGDLERWPSVPWRWAASASSAAAATPPSSAPCRASGR